MKFELLFAALLVLSAATTPGIAAANDPPLPDAGLDQTVTRGTTVYLDASGSRDPDGTIDRYQWTITGVDGDATNATTAACPTCERTQFQADATGRYRVTLEVTDDDGATATDSLYVTVEPGAPPSVSLAGPTTATTADAATFTADTGAGAAPLDRLVWKHDGDRVTTHDLSGDADTTARDIHFATTGDHDVTVVAFDEDGQRATDTRTVTVESPAPTDDTTTGSSDTTGSTPSVPATSPPDVHGPRVLTSEDALSGTYELGDGSSGTWILGGEPVATGEQTSQTFSPGVHELYATTEAGAATFPDDTRTVVADPAPEIETVGVENSSIVTVDVHATDDLGNLQSVTIGVDGTTVETITPDGLGTASTTESLSAVEHLSSLDPGAHQIRVTARDERGQKATVTRTVRVPGPPEVVSAGFVEDGPLDQYHPRIDESRYTATYRLVVDLNGVDPDKIQHQIEFPATDWASKEIRTISNTGNLLIEKRTFNRELGKITAQSKVATNRWSTSKAYDEIQVTSAPPELRISVDSPQSRDADTISGLKLDASDSFDPDGGEIDYDWYQVDGGHVERSWASLDSLDVAKLVVTDPSNQSTSTTKLLQWFAPDLRKAEVVETGPFYPNETVEIHVWSEVFQYSKPIYENGTSFTVESTQGRVVGHELGREPRPLFQIPEGETRARQHRWTVEVPAESFVNGSPSVTAVATEKPYETAGLSMPEPTVYVPTRTELQDVSTDVEYRVQRPVYEMRQTTSESYRDQLLGGGYEVAVVTNSGREYDIEERVKVADAEYDVERQSFQQRGLRSFYLENNPEWEALGSRTETRQVTRTRHEWRSHRRGEGTFTGDTRRKLVDRGRYRTEKQYRYETTESYETTETYEHTYTTTETHKVTKEHCTAFGCLNYQTVVEETEYHTVTRTRTVHRTRTVTETYWSTRQRGFSHEYTGQKRRITLEEPEYERQYEFAVEEQHMETNRVYLAEKRTLVEPARYEWQTTKTVTRRSAAERLARDGQVRIGDMNPTQEWILQKAVDSQVTTSKYNKPGWNVLQTRGTATGTVVEHYVQSDGQRTAGSKTRTHEVETRFAHPGHIDESTVNDILEEEMEEKYGE